MKLLQYLKEEKSRTKKITREEFIDALYTKCKQALNAAPIYRGNTNPFDYGFVSPGKYTRKSANTTNWYTFILNNSPSWSQYPKRSLICSFDKNVAETYGGGRVYRIFPTDNANIGICPAADIWMSFENKNIDSLENLNLDLDTIFDQAMGKQVRDESWDHMKYYAKQVPEWFKKASVTYSGKSHGMKTPVSEAVDFLKTHKYDGSDFIKFLENLLDPETNGFTHKKISSLHQSPGNKECWLDADCYMILETLVETVDIITWNSK